MIDRANINIRGALYALGFIPFSLILIGCGVLLSRQIRVNVSLYLFISLRAEAQ
jgi:hypothetical protein